VVDLLGLRLRSGSHEARTNATRPLPEEQVRSVLVDCREDVAGQRRGTCRARTSLFGQS
jgi:hypothetical protein